MLFRSDDESVLRMQAKGRASAKGLQSLVDHPVMKGLEGYLDYQAAISLEGQGMDLRLESDGLGLQSRLPSPLAKSAKEAWPIRVEMVPGQRFGGDIALQGIRRDDQIRIRLREDAEVWLGRERVKPQDPMRVASGVIAINSEALLPSRGLAISANVGHLEVDPWLTLMQEIGRAHV